MPKTLIKQLKQYALDHDTTLTAIAIEAFEEFLQRKKKDKYEQNNMFYLTTLLSNILDLNLNEMSFVSHLQSRYITTIIIVS